MREYVGTCMECGAQVYCHDGFIGGVVLEAGNLLCFPCFEAKDEKQEE
ncbi:hypothetical protein [Aneurinibacillus aneurinilyticus]|uniref:Uncharacterized protein n=2 Tax=Aneurinibacillus aneurinilyticus TaxID=1391 RepID=A0A848CVI4_ANEAE|nr:hypothetical protein [Aneurinibacillus aneurinilyticus]MCI1692540.1 hypothetical protein [Aneurinibacillus aneurinilyticus]MED0670972.1 hypothetical protein [Aneurinibacillus aneurinilyticus]MED0705200.1 hypothetical protein [Aneurinibacillus aneurinilyticus]MED0723039.1 hypothetical protein [Aneurinibacillus aneurinilyticus]MED0734686.1 hypothetical protein [Aneurinibacillus aneurinilyticus]